MILVPQTAAAASNEIGFVCYYLFFSICLFFRRKSCLSWSGGEPILGGVSCLYCVSYLSTSFASPVISGGMKEYYHRCRRSTTEVAFSPAFRLVFLGSFCFYRVTSPLSCFPLVVVFALVFVWFHFVSLCPFVRCSSSPSRFLLSMKQGSSENGIDAAIT